jgi:hypothetical protein
VAKDGCMIQRFLCDRPLEYPLRELQGNLQADYRRLTAPGVDCGKIS